jgi:hypothetical protein
LGTPRFRFGSYAADQLLIQLTDIFQSGFEFVVVGQATPYRSDLIVREADLANGAAGVAHGEDGDGMALTAGAFGATGAMADGAQEQGATEDGASLRESGEEAVAPFDDLLMFHQ